jgi:hypothetical protein
MIYNLLSTLSKYTQYHLRRKPRHPKFSISPASQKVNEHGNYTQNYFDHPSVLHHNGYVFGKVRGSLIDLSAAYQLTNCGSLNH